MSEPKLPVEPELPVEPDPPPDVPLDQTTAPVDYEGRDAPKPRYTGDTKSA